MSGEQKPEGRTGSCQVSVYCCWPPSLVFCLSLSPLIPLTRTRKNSHIMSSHPQKYQFSLFTAHTRVQTHTHTHAHPHTPTHLISRSCSNSSEIEAIVLPQLLAYSKNAFKPRYRPRLENHISFQPHNYCKSWLRYCICLPIICGSLRFSFPFSSVRFRCVRETNLIQFATVQLFAFCCSNWLDFTFVWLVILHQAKTRD